MIKFKEKHIVVQDKREIGIIEIDDTRRGYVYIPTDDGGLTWSDIYEIQCKLSDLNDTYMPS